jgi:RimJ/RimL family protein N-acetyltransferase
VAGPNARAGRFYHLRRMSHVVVDRLAGCIVELRPLDEADASALLDSITTDEVWAWKPVAQPRTVEEMRALIRDVLIGPSGTRHPLAVIRRADGRMIGSSSLYHVDLEHHRAEIGWTWLARDRWGQGYNEDLNHALLEYCFGPLGLERVQWLADGANLRSQRALERLGFTKEGVLRSHRLRTDGTRGDTAVYALLRKEWPAAAARLQSLIDERTPGPR